MQPSHFFKRHTEQFIYQESAAVNDKKSSTIYWQVVNGAGGLGAKPEVLARPVKDYKALVVAHDLFMAGWNTVVWGSWSLNSSRLLPLLRNAQTEQETMRKNKLLDTVSAFSGIRLIL